MSSYFFYSRFKIHCKNQNGFREKKKKLISIRQFKGERNINYNFIIAYLKFP